VKERKRKKPAYYGLLVVRGSEDDMYLQPARRNGDWELMARYIEDGNVITPAMRAFLAEVLRGLKRKKGAPRTRDTFERAFQIEQHVLDAMRKGQTESDAKKATAIKFNVDKRTVQRIMKWFNDYQREERQADEYSEMQDEWNEQNEREDWDDN
jgi:hypothetical protein